MSAENLNKNKADKMVTAIKALTGPVPYIGPLISEIISDVIPNQRIDRLCKYVLELERKLSIIEEEKIQEALKNEEGVGLFEEGFIQASRVISNDKRKYIANVVGNGIDDDTIEYVESKYILKLLEELNEQEIIWLRFYMVPTIGGDEEFRNKHKNVIEPIVATTASDERTIERRAIQNSFKEHLERLGLIRSHYDINRNTNIPDYDKFSGKPKVRFQELTPLGKLILKQIELL